jgi:hypothetical protein
MNELDSRFRGNDEGMKAARATANRIPACQGNDGFSCLSAFDDSTARLLPTRLRRATSLKREAYPSASRESERVRKPLSPQSRHSRERGNPARTFRREAPQTKPPYRGRCRAEGVTEGVWRLNSPARTNRGKPSFRRKPVRQKWSAGVPFAKKADGAGIPRAPCSGPVRRARSPDSFRLAPSRDPLSLDREADSAALCASRDWIGLDSGGDRSISSSFQLSRE